jgi:hypothetical protein
MSKNIFDIEDDLELEHKPDLKEKHDLWITIRMNW